MSQPADAAHQPPASSAIPWAGEVAPGFEPVRDTFVATIDRYAPGGGGFAAYHRGRKVVDLWGGWSRDGVPWQQDTLAVVFSCSKGVATFCLQVAVDRGLVDVDAYVADVWPAFGANGKERIRIRHILSHTSGVLAPVDAPSILTWAGTGWDDTERIEAGLAAAAPAVPIGCTFAYQAVAFGWLVSAVLRRVSGLTVGQFLAREVAVPLGLDVHIGTSAADLARVAPVRPFIPGPLTPEQEALAARADALAHDPSTLLGKALIAVSDGNLADHWEAFTLPGIAGPEMAGANGTATAAGLAGIYNVLASGGEVDGLRLVTPASIAQFRTIQLIAPNALDMEADPDPSTVELHHRMLGYHGSSRLPDAPGRLGPSETAFGHDGAGGQLAFADPERSLSAAFTRSQLSGDTSHSAALLEQLYACADRA